jgi:hypothetical protein
MTLTLLLAAASLGLYAAMPALGLPWIVAAHLALTAGMIAAWRIARRSGKGAWRAALLAAIAFRLAMVAAPPMLSDDVYRYVWDGRVQAKGHHPYKFAPSDPMRAELRDDAVYPKINHPEIPTIYPPLAEMLFAGLAWAGLGVTGFKAAMALCDVGVIVALSGLLRALGRPRELVLLYAWNPLAVVETSWSGHVEPAGVLLLLLAITAITRGRGVRAAAALAAAVQTKLLPLLLVPGFVRRLKTREVAVLVLVAAAITAPYAMRGPAYGAGVLAYAHRWEHGSIAFPGVLALYERLDPTPALKSAIAWAQARWGSADTRAWDVLYRSVWPQELARLTVGLAALVWAVAQSFRPRIDAAHEARVALGGALLLAPTLHPWYVLWVLPLAACAPAGGWLLAAALMPLQYLRPEGDVLWPTRLAILLPALAWMGADAWRERRRRAAPGAT